MLVLLRGDDPSSASSDPSCPRNDGGYLNRLVLLLLYSGIVMAATQDWVYDDLYSVDDNGTIQHHSATTESRPSTSDNNAQERREVTKHEKQDN